MLNDPAPNSAPKIDKLALERNARLLETVAATHHSYVVREEIERADVERAHYFAGLRKTLIDGDVDEN